MDNNNALFSYSLTLKIICFLSIAFVLLDLVQIYYLISSIPTYYEKLPLEAFNSCIRYQTITDIFFAIFGIMTGASATVLSLGMIYDTDYFTSVIFDAYLHYNYILFGPFLLVICCFGFYFFDSIAYTCDSNNYNIRYVNFTTVMCLLFSLSFSLIITIVFSVVRAIESFMKSVRFEIDGNYLLGKAFWYYVFSFRSNDNANQNQNSNANNTNSNIRLNGIDFQINNNDIINI